MHEKKKKCDRCFRMRPISWFGRGKMPLCKRCSVVRTPEKAQYGKKWVDTLMRGIGPSDY